MNKTDILGELREKGTLDFDIAEKVVKSPDLLPELLKGIGSTNPRIRLRSAKILRMISEWDPEMLYSDIDFFVNLLDSENNILKWNALDIIANLATVDSNNIFDRLFRKYYSYLYMGSLITAGHVVDNSGKIALAKPELQDEITKKLLGVEEVPVPTEECRNILIGKTIKAFEVYYDKIKNRDEVVSFVKKQLSNSRNATKAKAERFLKRYGGKF